MKEVVAIVDILSTGFNLIQDCFDRDLEPVAIEPCLADKETEDFWHEERLKKLATVGRPVRVIKEDPDYSKTLELVKSLNPKVILPGAETGVILATHLADDLGLKGNPFSIIGKMTNKYETHLALKNAGVRYIRGKMVKNVEEALAFYDELDTDNVVVKPAHGSGSMGVRFCDSREMLKNIFEEQQGTVGLMGDRADELLIQERIIGEEYIVNTITANGEHRVASIWKYEKRALENGSNAYVGETVISSLTPEVYELVKYAFRAIDAVGIKQGPVHGEYMIDKKGPVLIEVNCRCMGSSYPIGLGNAVYGHHETDMALESYLNPQKVLDRLSGKYGVKKYAMMKDIISPRRMSIASSPIIGLLPYLKSFYSCSINSSALSDELIKTVDLETEAGMINMVHEDYSVIRQEYDLLCELEDKYFGLLYQESFDKSLGALPFIEAAKESLDSFVMTATNLKNYPLEDVYQYLKDIVKAVKTDGTIIIPKAVYDEFPYGKAGIIMVLKMMGLSLLLPEFGKEEVKFIKK